MSYRPSGRGYGGGGSGGYGGGGFGRDSFGKKPVEVGKEYDVEITEISRRGDGIAKIEGFVIFVSGAKAQTKVRIKVTSVGPRFASAQLVSGGSEGMSSSADTSGSDEQAQ